MWANEVVVGLDGSASANAALQWAARYAKFSYTDVRVIHVSTCSIATSLAWSAGFPGMEDLLNPDPDTGQKLALGSMFEAVQPEPDWVLEHHEGCPGPILVSQSRDAQLLIIGNRHRNALSRLLTGSTSRYCLTNATCPVVAVPEREPWSGGGAGLKDLRWGRRRRRQLGNLGAPPPLGAIALSTATCIETPTAVARPAQRPRLILPGSPPRRARSAATGGRLVCLQRIRHGRPAHLGLAESSSRKVRGTQWANRRSG